MDRNNYRIAFNYLDRGAAYGIYDNNKVGIFLVGTKHINALYLISVVGYFTMRSFPTFKFEESESFTLSGIRYHICYA